MREMRVRAPEQPVGSDGKGVLLMNVAGLTISLPCSCEQRPAAGCACFTGL
jgi:hypothetical protein